MEKKIFVLNLLLIFIAGILTIMIIRIWAKPESLFKVENIVETGSQKILQKFSTKRKIYSASIVSRITDKNLFRKERAEFKTEAPVVVAPASSVLLPAPVIKVNGILLLQGVRIAVIEGHYSVLIDEAKTETKDIKKKGYRVGDYIGNYQIIEINRTLVTLKNETGDVLTAKLKQRTSTTPIKWDGRSLFYKPKKADDNPEPKPVPIAKTETHSIEEPLVTQSQPTLVQSKPTPTEIKPPTAQYKPMPHISGRPQKTARHPAFISGALTAPKRTRPHISGR